MVRVYRYSSASLPGTWRAGFVAIDEACLAVWRVAAKGKPPNSPARAVSHTAQTVSRGNGGGMATAEGQGMLTALRCREAFRGP